MLRLRWPQNPKVVQEGEPLDLSLRLDNVGSEVAEFADAFLVLFGRLLGQDDREIRTEGFRLGRRMPLIRYRIEPGDSETVSVALTLSPEDQRLLAPGQYAVVIPLDDQRDESPNSLLTSTGAEPPERLTVEVRTTSPHR